MFLRLLLLLHWLQQFLDCLAQVLFWIQLLTHHLLLWREPDVTRLVQPHLGSDGLCLSLNQVLQVFRLIDVPRHLGLNQVLEHLYVLAGLLFLVLGVIRHLALVNHLDAFWSLNCFDTTDQLGITLSVGVLEVALVH